MDWRGGLWAIYQVGAKPPVVHIQQAVPNPSCLQGIAVSSESSNANWLILHLTKMNQPEGK